MRYYHTVPFPVADITIVEEDGSIVSLKFEPDTGDAIKKETPLIREAFRQLSDYFDGKLNVFDLPVKLSGTPFQMKTWAALQTIPFGETRSYGEIAKQIGNSKASRAVGMANHHNPVSIIVPCHRVIGANGSLTGYGGGLAIKQQLLALEKQYFHDRYSTLF